VNFGDVTACCALDTEFYYFYYVVDVDGLALVLGVVLVPTLGLIIVYEAAALLLVFLIN
jgi:hypothetical protein